MIFRSNFFRRLSEGEPTGFTKPGKNGRVGRTRQRSSRRADSRRLLERDLRFESLEARRVLAVAAMLDGDNNAVLTGSGAADTITLTVDSGRLVVIDTGGATANAGFTQDAPNTISIPLADILGGNLFVNTGGGNDTLTVDFANGSPVPSGGIVYTAGESVGDNDSLEIIGYNVGTVTATHTGPESGTVAVGGAPLIRFFETEPLLLGGSAANLIINLPAGSNPDTVLGDDLGGVAGVSEIRGSTFEDTTFANPTTSLTVNAFAGADTITMLALDAAYAATTNINTGGGIDQVRIAATPANTTTNVDTQLGVPGDLLIIGAVPGSGGTIATTRAQFNTGQGTLDFLGANSIINYDDDGGVGELFVDDSGDATADNVTITSGSITGASAATINYVGPNINIVQLALGTGNDTVNVSSTGADDFGGGTTTLFGNNGNDTFNIAANALSGRNVFHGDGGNDNFNLNFPAGTTVGQDAEGYSPFMSLQINGNAPASDPTNRDAVNVNTNAVGDGVRDVTIAYVSTASGDIEITGLGGTIDLNGIETLDYTGDAANNDLVTVVGTSAGNDLITVAPVGAARALVFNNSPLDVGGPYNAPPEIFPLRIPGVSGGSVRPDLDLSGLANLTGLTITDPGPGTGDRLYVYGESSLGLNDGNAFDAFGFGPGQILPAVGQPAAFDVITVSDTRTTVDGHVAVNYNATDFIQADPATQPAVVINGGDEGNPLATPGVDVADDITLIRSDTYRFQVNGGYPDPAFTGIVPPDGDRLFVSSVGDLSVFSDKAFPPNVSVIDVSGNLPFGFSSIESLVFDAQGGAVNLLGDNNFTQNQTDNFVVRGNGPNAFTLEINGSAPIQFVNVTYLNVIGGEDIDTLEITAWADNTTQGWGIQVFFDEGTPDQTDGGQEDLLIYNTVAANPVSENIVIQPSGPESGELRVTNAVDNSAIVIISYINNLDIIVQDNDGFLSDTDTLTLRGTNPDPGNPNAPSGLEDFLADFSAAGDVANPMVTVIDDVSGLMLYQLRNFTNFNSINIEPLGGSDFVEITGRDDGSLTVNVDNGAPTGVGGSLDVDTIAVSGVINASDTFSYFPGAAPDTGRFEVTRAVATAPTIIHFHATERLTIDGSGGAGADTLNVNGTSGANQFAVNQTSALNGAVSVDGFTAISYQGLGGNAVLNLIGGGNNSSLILTGTGGQDTYTYTPTASDSANLLLNDGVDSAQFNLSGFGSALLNADTSLDTLNVTVDNALITPGATADSGRVTATTAGGQGLLPLDYQSFESVTVVGGTVVVNGTAENDVITIDAAGLVTVANQGGIVLQSYDLLGAGTVIVSGLGGDDTINVIGSVPFVGGLTVIGGEPDAGSDVLNLIGAAGVSDDVEIRPNSSNPLEQEVTGLGGVIIVNGIELITYAGDGGDDNLTVETGNANDTARLDGGISFDELTSSSLPTIRFTGINDFTLNIVNGIDTATVNPVFLLSANRYFVDASVSDTVIFEGAGDDDLWTLTNPLGGDSLTLADNSPAHSGAAVTVMGDPQNIVLNTLGGDDVVTIDVSVDGPISLPITFHGDDGRDTLLVIGTPPAGDFDSVIYSPGPGIDAGRLEYVTGADTEMRIDFTGLEPVIDATGATMLVVNGTNADNAINYTQGSIAAHGLVSVDGFETIEFTNKSNLVINGLAGSDTINLNNPNTPTGLASITVNGGDPSAGDTVIVNGTTSQDTVNFAPTAADTTTITGLGPQVQVTGADQVVYDGQGGDDDLTFTSPVLFESVEWAFTPGVNPDSGIVTGSDTTYEMALLGVRFQGVGNSGNVNFINSGGPRLYGLDIYGTGTDDQFNVDSAGSVQIVKPTYQLPVSLNINTPGITYLRLMGGDGDDIFNVPGDHPFSAGILVAGGNPSASDVLNFVGSGAGQVSVNLGAGVIAEFGFSPADYTGIERINLNAGEVGPQIIATDDDDDVTVTVLGVSSGMVQLGATAQQGGQAQPPLVAPLVHYTNTAGNAVDIDLGAGEDTLIVVGNSLPQAFGVNGLTQTVSINDNDDATNDGFVTYQNAESLAVYGLEGRDTFIVTGGPIPIYIDGGDPIGAQPGDSLIMVNAFAYFTGPENDEGGFLTLGGPEGIVSFDHIESIIVAPEEADDCPFVIFGTNGDDDITVIARDGSTHGGADGMQDFTVSINSGLEMLFLDQPALVIDALAGDDDVVIRGPAPNQTAWGMQLTLIGGPASGITGDQGDVLMVETPGLVNTVYTPTGSDTGLLAITNTNGLVANITVQNTPYIPGPDCPPLPEPLIGGNGGFETLIYDGEGFGDSLTIVGTVEADTIVHTPGSGIDAGSVRVNTLLGIQYQNLAAGELIVDGVAEFDTLVADGTGLSDSLTVAAITGAVTLANSHGTRLAIQQLNLEALVLNGLEGDDTFTIEAPQPYASIAVNGGGPGASDVLQVNGADGVNEGFVVSPGFNRGTGSLAVDALGIAYSGVEHLLLDANDGDTDTLTVNDDLADNLWTVNAGPRIGDRIQIDGRESIDFNDFQTTTLVNEFGTDQFRIYPTHLIGTAALIVLANGGVRDDVLTLVATEADDVATSTADTITINDTVPVTVGNAGAGFAEVQLLSLGGDDHVTLSLDLPGVRKFVDGGAGNDFIDLSGTLDAVLFGGDGDDYIIGSPVADFIDGGRGSDILFGGGGNDVIYGGEGNDILIGGTGGDQMVGNAGDDTFIWNPGDASDLIDGGTGNNVLQFVGGAVADAFTLSADGTPLRLTRQPGNVVLDVANVQQVDVNATISFSGLLSGAQEVPPVATAATGRTFLTYDSATNTFDIDVFVQGITLANLAAAHIHAAAAGANGPVIFDLGTAGWFVDGGGLRRRISGATFPVANIGDLLAGNTYVNIHTPANPAGEIRGQLNPLAAGQGLGGADTFEVFDLDPTDVRVVNLGLGSNNGGVTDGATDSVRVHGRTTDDSILVTSRPNPAGAAFADLVNVAGLRYDVNVSNAIAADGDLLTMLGNQGDDLIHAEFGVEQTILITLDGGAGADHLIADGTLIGGTGDDLLVGGPGNNLFFGGDGNDTMVGGGADDTYDGGTGFDTILVEATPGADTIDVFQASSAALRYTVNGVVQNETLVPQTVEEVLVEAGAGADLIRVRTADALFNQADTALRTTVVGGTATGAGDRLIVVDDGVDDLSLYRKGVDETGGTVEIGPSNPQPFLVVFSDIERVQFVDENGVAINQSAAAGPRLAVFQPDLFEYNDDRLVALHLGSGQTTNLTATIDPGPILDPFGDGQNVPSDQDWYRVVAEVTGTLDFQVYFTQIDTLASGRPGLPGAGNLDIEVRDAAGNLIAGFGVNDATNDERRRIPAVAGQTYYLRVFGNAEAINAYNVTVVNTAPAVPFDIELQDTPVGDPPPLNSETGRSQFDNVTRDNTPTIYLRLDDGSFRFDVQGNDPGAGGFPNNPPIQTIPIPFQTLAVAGYRVAIFDEGPTPGQPATNPQIPVGFAEAVAGSPGLYRFTFPAALSDGSHFLSARVQIVDPSAPQQTGFGPRSESLEIIVDTEAPPVALGLPGVMTDGLHPDSDSGVEGNPTTFTDRITNDTTPTFWGTAEANSIIRAYIDVNQNGVVDNLDILIGFTLTQPLDGTNQFPAGRWELTSTVDMNSTQARNLAGGLSPLPEDGLRRILVTAEDVAGNVSLPDVMSIFIDTQGPQVTDVFITGEPGFDLFLNKFDGLDALTPTPLIHSLSIRIQDLPSRVAEFLYQALDNGVALNPGHYSVRGDFSGIIPIDSVQFISDPLVPGQPARGTIVLDFVVPLPDDRFTLTISDSLVDPAGNRLDGETNAVEPIANPSFPTGDGQPGGNFTARFTVDSRPELGVWAAGSVWVDTNGNFTFDPGNPDFVNRDITYVMGFTSDHIFAGNFRNAGPNGIAGTADDGAADGFDKLAAYGRVAGQFRWLIDTDNDGVSDPPQGIVDPAGVNGLPVAGNFNPAIPGDQVGLFDGTHWHFDTTGNYRVNAQVTIPGMTGYPVVGDFNGDGLDDLGTWADDTFQISLAGTPGGVGALNWSTTLVSFRFGFIGVRERPVAADMDQDGFTDLGLWVPDRSGVTPNGGGEWYFLVSGGDSILDRIVPDAAGVPFIPFTPVPFGNDLYREFGDEFALPIVGNFDPPPGVGEANVVGRLDNPYDVDANGRVEPLDALLVLNHITRHGNGSPAPSGDASPFPDVNRDGIVNPLDSLLVLNYLSQSALTGGGASAEGENARGLAAPGSLPTGTPTAGFHPTLTQPSAEDDSNWQSYPAWTDLLDTLAEASVAGQQAIASAGGSAEAEAEDERESLVDSVLASFVSADGLW